MVHIPGLSRPFKSNSKAPVRPPSPSPSPSPTSNPPLEDPTTGSVPLRNPATDQLEGGKGSNTDSDLKSDFKAGNPEDEGIQADDDSHARLIDEGDEAGKSIVLEPEVEIVSGGAQGGPGILPSEATDTPTSASTFTTIPNPRKSGSSDKSTTSSKSGSENRKGRTGGITRSPRAACEIDPISSSVKDNDEEMNQGIEKSNETKKDEKGQGREKERSTVVVGKRDRKRSTDTSSSSSSIKAGSGSGSGFTREVVEDENKVSCSYRYIDLKVKYLTHSQSSNCSS
jgi:hypothetical protein